MGCVVEEKHPDFSEADEIFKVWRAWEFALKYGELVKSHPEEIKETVIWNVEEGLKLTGPQIARAEMKRTELFHRVRRFMERHEFLVMPVTQVPPFGIEQRYVTKINTVEMKTYIDWMKS